MGSGICAGSMDQCRLVSLTGALPVLQLILQALKEERGECSMEYLRKLNDEVRLCLLQV